MKLMHINMSIENMNQQVFWIVWIIKESPIENDLFKLQFFACLSFTQICYLSSITKKLYYKHIHAKQKIQKQNKNAK